ncbi:MAG: TRAP transporter small permease [Alphaproteobacteria bacterium]|nr:TRAP transporter small permease [Alphaproteobacteria bacterium]
MNDGLEEPLARGAPPSRVPAQSIRRPLEIISEALAVLGGLSLTFVTLFTTASVIGRTALNAPILGDQELVEYGCSFAIFAFMPYCQIRGSNIVADVFTQPLPEKWRNVIDAVMNTIFAVVVLLLAWRLMAGGLNAFARDDNSMFLRIPLWFGYFAASIFSIVWCAVCLYTAYASIIGAYRRTHAGVEEF